MYLLDLYLWCYMWTCEIKTSDKTERRDITHDKLHFIFIFHWNCFCSCVNHYPHEEAEMSQGALQCTGWPVPLQFKDKCWQWKENWLTMIFQLHHTSYLIRHKVAFSITGELQLEATDQFKGKHGNQKKIELICPHEILFLNKTTSMVIQHISSQLFWRKWKWSK